MDFYNSNYYEDDNYTNLVYDNGEYSLTSYYFPNDYPNLQDSTTSFEYQDFASNPPFFTDYDHVSSYSSLANYATSYSEPKYLEYEPVPHHNMQIKFFVSYSVNSLDDTEYDEYDPTPYGGGYDIVSTYGKPLFPSDKTCYPRQVPNQNSSSLSQESLATQHVDDSAPKPPIETKPSSVIEVTDKSSEMEHGEQAENGYYQVPYVPSGSGLEAMDVCEGLFGYWPCLSKIKRTSQDCHECGHCYHCGSHSIANPWNKTADYLFGSLDPYCSRNDGGNFGVYGYEKQYQGQNQVVKFVSDPWLG